MPTVGSTSQMMLVAHIVLHRHSQRLIVSLKSLEPIKMTVKIIHYMGFTSIIFKFQKITGYYKSINQDSDFTKDKG